VVDQGTSGLAGLGRVVSFYGFMQRFKLLPVNLPQFGVQAW
jgi:hypothetical protein